jgi:hypothetical protein
MEGVSGFLCASGWSRRPLWLLYASHHRRLRFLVRRPPRTMATFRRLPPIRPLRTVSAPGGRSQDDSDANEVRGSKRH